MKEATEEELKAEVSRQAAVLAEFFPDSRRASSSGHGRSRGSGPAGQGGGLGAGGRGGLLVSRFTPVQAKAAQAEPPAEAASSSRPGEDEGKASKKRRRKEEEDTVTANLNPAFARVFRGGPRRKEADLPDMGDEGVEEVPAAPPQEQDGGATAGWLTSLGEAPDEPAAAPPAEPERGPADIDWLGSLKGVTAPGGAAAAAGKGKEAGVGVAQPSAAVAAWAGKPLDIAPFWRTQPEEELLEVFLEQQSELWQRMRRLARDAKRREEKRGRVRARNHF